QHLDANHVILRAGQVCDRMAQDAKSAEGNDVPLIAVEAFVLVSKSCRWPTESRDAGLELLTRAEGCIGKQMAPDAQVTARARIAAAYARLGFLRKARELAES